MINFDKEAFLEWLRNEFPTVVNTWVVELVDNLIDFIMETTCDDDFFIESICAVIPEVEVCEIKRFMNNSPADLSYDCCGDD